MLNWLKKGIWGDKIKTEKLWICCRGGGRMVTSKRAIHASKPPDDKCRRDTEINVQEGFNN